MQVLLTGGSGSVGKAVIERLVNNGYAVRVIGRREGMSFEGAEYQSCDINDFPRLREVIRGCDAVVHLAALPNPAAGRPEEVFHVNAQGTFNVFQAAAEEGIKRVVQASSINATGQFYGVKPAPLYYLPMDEEHPLFATDVYSFSKHIIEDIGEYFWRREGISSVALRLPWVAPREVHENWPERYKYAKMMVDQLLERTPEERQAWFDLAWKMYNDFRAQRPYETPHGFARQKMSEMPEDQRAMLGAMTQRTNFFTLLDERDSAQAIEKGLTADYEGSHPLFVNDSYNSAGIESKIIAELFFPDVKVFKKELVGTETVISIDKARELIGFEPEFSFGKERRD